MSAALSVGRALALALATAAAPAAAGAQSPPGAPVPLPPPASRLSLADALSLALERNEAIVIERAALGSAVAAVDRAKGAYDPLLQLDGGWRRASPPVNSALSGAPSSRLSPTTESGEGGVQVRQVLPTGGVVTVGARGLRESTDGAFQLLSPAYSTQVGVEVRQPLLRDRAVDGVRLNIRVAASDRRRAEASLRREVVETVAAVEDAYWSLASARRLTEVREQAVDLAQEQLSETTARIEKGAAPENEIAQPRAELERRRGELLESMETLSRTENSLKLLMLGDTDTELWSESIDPVQSAETEIVPVDVAASMRKALDSRPELQEVEAALERRRAESAFARDGVRPALDAVISYSRFGLAGQDNPSGVGLDPNQPPTVPSGLRGRWGQSLETLGEGDFDDARAGLEFSIPIGNRSARAAAAIARGSEIQAEAALTLTRKTIRAEVLDAAAALDSAGQRIEAARAEREAAEVQLSSEKDRYAVGLSTNFLVLTRQNDLSRARLAEIEALTDYRKARTEMARATGSLLAERGIEVKEARK